ncbi:MAG: serine hydrolase domain-containing protein [Gemmatimonadales bacterium]
MALRVIGIALAALVSLAAIGRAQSPEDPVEKADAWLKEQLAARKIPGLAVTVIRDGAVLFERAYGLANVELVVPVTTRTRFVIASTTKAWAATAILMLVGQGKLGLDQPIGELLPHLPRSWRGVPVRRLLSHTSGLPDVMLSANTGELLSGDRDSALTIAGGKPLDFPVGTAWSYNQTNYTLLGMIIDRVTGSSFMPWILEHLASPLGLTSPVFGDSRAVVPGRATMYTRWALEAQGPPKPLDSLRVASYLYQPWIHMAAGLNMTATDLARFGDAVRAGRLISPALRDTMWTAIALADGETFRFGGTAGMGLGWIVDDDPKGKVVGMDGGAAASLRVYPAKRLSAAVLTNLQGAGPDELAQGVAAFFE